MLPFWNQNETLRQQPFLVTMLLATLVAAAACFETSMAHNQRDRLAKGPPVLADLQPIATPRQRREIRHRNIQPNELCHATHHLLCLAQRKLVLLAKQADFFANAGVFFFNEFMGPRPQVFVSMLLNPLIQGGNADPRI